MSWIHAQGSVKASLGFRHKTISNGFQYQFLTGNYIVLDENLEETKAKIIGLQLRLLTTIFAR